jgi:hypothetical protein
MYLTESLNHSRQRTAFPKAFLAQLGIEAECAEQVREPRRVLESVFVAPDRVSLISPTLTHLRGL